MSCLKCSRDTSFAFFFIFFLTFIVAFSTPFWYQIEFVHRTLLMGLWLSCTDDLDKCRAIGGDVDSALKSTRALMCLALIFYSTSMISYCVWISKRTRYLRDHGAGPVGMTAITMALIGGIFNVIGSVVFGAEYVEDLFDDPDLEDYYLHGSFVSASVAGAMQVFISVFTLCIFLCCSNAEQPSASPPGVASEATVTVITDGNPVAATVPPVPPATVPFQYPPPVGYVPQGGYPPQVGYPSSYPMPAGVFSPSGVYPAGYPAPESYPTAGVGSPQDRKIAPNDEDGLPPAYEESTSKVSHEL